MKKNDRIKLDDLRRSVPKSPPLSQLLPTSKDPKERDLSQSSYNNALPQSKWVIKKGPCV